MYNKARGESIPRDKATENRPVLYRQKQKSQVSNYAHARPIKITNAVEAAAQQLFPRINCARGLYVRIKSAGALIVSSKAARKRRVQVYIYILLRTDSIYTYTLPRVCRYLSLRGSREPLHRLRGSGNKEGSDVSGKFELLLFIFFFFSSSPIHR